MNAYSSTLSRFRSDLRNFLKNFHENGRTYEKTICSPLTRGKPARKNHTIFLALSLYLIYSTVYHLAMLSSDHLTCSQLAIDPKFGIYCILNSHLYPSYTLTKHKHLIKRRCGGSLVAHQTSETEVPQCS